MKVSFYLEQDILPHRDLPARISVRRYNHQETIRAVMGLLKLEPVVLGVAIEVSSKGYVQALALSTSHTVVLLTVNSKNRSSLTTDSQLRDVLLGSSVPLAGFGMAYTALRVNRDWLYNVRAVDLSTLLSPPKKAWSPSQCVKEKLSWGVDTSRIDRIFEGGRDSKLTCCRAWISAILAGRYLSEVQSSLKVDTTLLTKKELNCLAELVIQDRCLENAKPTEVKNEFTSIRSTKDGDISLQNARFRNRVRRSNQTSVVMTTHHGQEVIGWATGAKGRTSTITTRHKFSPKGVTSVRVVGREELTNPERARNEFVLCVLRGEHQLCDSLFIQLLWFLPTRKGNPVNRLSGFSDMNDSQRRVISHMVSGTPPLVIAHGPPGTGKSSTIACAASIWNAVSSPSWIVAHSNVAVKNIAQSLMKRGVSFKLIVSQEFYVEWHEHIYVELQNHLVVSNELPDGKVGMERLLNGTHIILSTLAILSNPVLEENGLFDLVPVERLVIDEASQIDIFEYMHLFHKFRRLHKVCFFGDPKQLPPYGKDTVPSLKSIFDVKHLKPSAFFLNTQCLSRILICEHFADAAPIDRMPIPIGTFISQEVYKRKLLSEHKITDMSCVSFIDVTKGCEENSGTSWKNMAEVNTIVHLVRYYYRLTDFCIITPYDAQRAAIERQLKAEQLPSDRVFNVDSFQGNEADYVIISVVRTESPGFLWSNNRINVMLTRCRVGMVIATNRNFLTKTNAQSTLLGKLAKFWETNHQGMTWKDWKLVAEQKADMPGVLGLRRIPPVLTSIPPPMPNCPTAAINLGGWNRRARSKKSSKPSATTMKPINGSVDSTVMLRSIPPHLSGRPTTSMASLVQNMTNMRLQKQSASSSPRVKSSKRH